ncbi:response regulator [Microvirga subterranea]|uniref:response regulator n=1 Tax=Microvirga subterranea TaxID=186651 RepID=UPI001474A593|nr:response regulator [Microvirga subterranea]
MTEDDAIVGFDLTDILEAAGYRIAGPVNSSAKALDWLRANVPDAVVLDVVLKDGSCTEIVRELRRRQIPFLIYSGRRQHQADLDLSDAKWLEKPAAHHDILTALACLLGTSGS